MCLCRCVFINVSLPSDFWSLVQSHSSVFAAAAVQLVNFPWDRRALDYCIPNDCVWEGDIVFDLARPRHWDTHIPPLEMHLLVGPLVLSAVGPDCVSVESHSLLRHWYDDLAPLFVERGFALWASTGRTTVEL